MKKKRLFPLILLFLILFSYNLSLGKSNVKIYFFWGEGCPHCAAEKRFLEKLKEKYPEIEIEMIEVWNNKDNSILFKRVIEIYGIKTPRVPITIIGNNQPIIGFYNESVSGKIIENTLIRCIESGCKDKLKRYFQQESLNQLLNLNTDLKVIDLGSIGLSLPFMNNLKNHKISLLFFTVIIALIDGFNPCAFYILIFLMSLLIYAGSAKKMAFIGIIFVTFSALIYFTFMVAWLNLFFLIGKVKIVTMVAGSIAILISLINIKDFFIFKKGLSLTISEKGKYQIFKRARKLVYTDSLFITIIGTVALAILTNLYELLCTAGFPMIYTRILTLEQLDKTQYYLYLALYNTIYVTPLMFITVGFCLTIRNKRLTELQVRKLKLLSGFIMLSIGFVLILKPSMINNILYMISIIFGAIIFSIVLPYFLIKDT